MKKNYEFKIGDKVKIRQDSEYYLGIGNNPKGTTGTVVRFNEGWEHHMHVDWGNGWENCHRDYDLELVTEEPSNEEQNVNILHKDDIRSIRDRIWRIEEELMKLQEEKDLLVGALKDEGFILVTNTLMENEVNTPAEDMSDWRNWEVGDKVEMLSAGVSLSKGSIYPITDLEDGREYFGILPVEVDGEWPLISTVRWHSRLNK